MSGSSVGTLDGQVRKGLSQAGGVGGGVLVDITGAGFGVAEAIHKVAERLSRSAGDYVILMQDNRLIAYIAEK